MACFQSPAKRVDSFRELMLKTLQPFTTGPDDVAVRQESCGDGENDLHDSGEPWPVEYRERQGSAKEHHRRRSAYRPIEAGLNSGGLDDSNEIEPLQDRRDR